MSKAKERAFKEYPVFMTTLIPADDEHPPIEQDCNTFTREAYIKGYHQAEKDNKLTWKDIKLIYNLVCTVSDELGLKGMYTNIYQEVLKQFNEKGRK